MKQNHSQPAKTVVAMHDLSSVGRCALTVAIPILSAMGIQPIPAPTAVLSAHTAFPEFVAQDLADYLSACLNEWQRMQLKFDCVYTGYLANARQADIALHFLKEQADAFIVVDPVLGDDGQMYRALPKEMPEAMKKLCAAADLITPNLTEAALLTGQEYPGSAVSESMLRELLEKLLALGAKTVLITGVILNSESVSESVSSPAPLGTHFSDLSGKHVNAWMQKDGALHTLSYAPVHAAFPGTGDLFASVVAGACTLGFTLEKAVAVATEYTRIAMQHTVDCATTPVFGVQLEQTLNTLISMLQK